MFPSRKQTFISAVGMSAMGQKWTHAPQQKSASFNQLVGAVEQLRWDGQAEGLRGL